MRKAATPAPVEQFTIAINETQAGGTITMTWADTMASVDFTVKH
jgi:hypothetical protein